MHMAETERLGDDEKEETLAFRAAMVDSGTGQGPTEFWSSLDNRLGLIFSQHTIYYVGEAKNALELGASTCRKVGVLADV